NGGRIAIGAQMVGLTQGALNCDMHYGGENQAFGRYIRAYIVMKIHIVRIVTEITAARRHFYNTVSLTNDGKTFYKAAAMAKYFSSEVAEKAASLAIEIYGGYGYTRDYPVEKYYRDAKIGKIYEGTTNMQLSTIARCLWPSKSS